MYKLDTLTKKDYRVILEQILVPKKQEVLLYYNQPNFRLKHHEAAAIVDRAFNSGQGIRAMKRELDKITADLEFEYEEVEQGEGEFERALEHYDDLDAREMTKYES